MHYRRAADAALAQGRAVVTPVVAGREASPKDVQNTERLMAYWASGEGAAKIGWGVDGDFERCRTELGKHVSPGIVSGLCANLHHRALGVWPGQEHSANHKKPRE